MSLGEHLRLIIYFKDQSGFCCYLAEDRATAIADRAHILRDGLDGLKVVRVELALYRGQTLVEKII